MLNKFEEFNKTRVERGLDKKKIVIASMDIDKFYPNIIAENSAKTVRQMWEDSKLSVAGIEIDEVSFYLGKYLTPEEIEQEGFKDLVYIKKKKEKIKRKNGVGKKTGKKYCRKNQMETLDTKGSGGKGTLDTNPGGGKRKNLDENTKICVEQKPKNKVCINDTHENKNKNTDNKDPTGPGYKNKNKNVKDNYLEPKRKPTAIEKRRLFGKALEILLVTALKNHVYQFGNEIRVQKRGGPIGLKLTG